MAIKLGGVNLLHVPFVNMIVGMFPEAYEEDEEYGGGESSVREPNRMWITEDELKGLIDRANEEALKGRKLVSVEFQESADRAGFITMLNYQKPE